MLEINEILKNAIIEKYGSIAEGARQMGLHAQNVGDHIRKRIKIKPEQALIYNKKLGIPIEKLIFEKPPTNELLVKQPITQGIELPCRFKVGAGTWEELHDLNGGYSEPFFGYAPITPDSNYPISEQWVEIVVGDSVNKIFPDGSKVHVREFYSKYEGWPIGKLVIVAHYKNGLMKRTIKRLILQNGKPTLIGESTIDFWNTPIVFNEPTEEGEIAKIEGIVLKGLVIV